jgi:cell shape-determining protein MreC
MRPGPFGVTLGLVLLVSMLPARWIAPWTLRASELVGLPLVPLGDGWMAVRHWLVRPEGQIVSTEDAAVLENEIRHLRLQLNALRLENLRLKAESKGFAGTEGESVGRPKVVEARVVGSEPHGSGERHYRVNAGMTRGSEIGAQVVTRTDLLLGEVVEVARTMSLVRPLTSVQTRKFEARVLLDGDADETLPRGLASPTGDGWTMIVTADSARGIRPGNEVVMDDWMRPNAAGLRFGRVVTVKPDPSNAQWNIVVVEPLLSIEKEYVVELWIAPRSEASDVEDVP